MTNRDEIETRCDSDECLNDIDMNVFTTYYSRNYMGETISTPVHIYCKEDKEWSEKDGYYSKYYYLEKIAKNPYTGVEMLEELSNDEFALTRSLVALNPSLSIELMEKLSKDNDIWVRYNLVWNKNCPDEILKKLSKDDNCQVKRAVYEKIMKRCENLDPEIVDFDDETIIIKMNK